jgi:hypothetical protein
MNVQVASHRSRSFQVHVNNTTYVIKINNASRQRHVLQAQHKLMSNSFIADHTSAQISTNSCVPVNDETALCSENLILRPA